MNMDALIVIITCGLISFLISGIYHFNNVRKNKKLFAIFGALDIVFGILSIFFESSIVDICAVIGVTATWFCWTADLEEILSSTSYLIKSAVKSISGAIKKTSSKKEAELQHSKKEANRKAAGKKAQEQKVSEPREIVYLSNHKVWCKRKLWSDKCSRSYTFPKSIFREVEVTETTFAEGFLYTDGQLYFVVQKISTHSSAQAVPNCAGWTYSDSDKNISVRQALYNNVYGDWSNKRLRQVVQEDHYPCATRDDGNTQALFEEYFDEKRKMEYERQWDDSARNISLNGEYR